MAETGSVAVTATMLKHIHSLLQYPCDLLHPTPCRSHLIGNGTWLFIGWEDMAGRKRRRAMPSHKAGHKRWESLTSSFSPRPWSLGNGLPFCLNLNLTGNFLCAILSAVSINNFLSKWTLLSLWCNYDGGRTVCVGGRTNKRGRRC